MEEFELLLHRYLANVASREERIKLYELINSGVYDDFIGADISLTLRSEIGTQETDFERLRMDRLYDERIAGAIMPSESSLNSDSDRHIRWYTKWLWSAACVALISAGIWWTFDFSDAVPARLNLSLRAAEPPVSQNSIARFTDRQVVRLPDGSSIFLNDGSELSYTPSSFGLTSREVELHGEGFFDIVSDPSRPFYVKTGKVVTKVLGTAFNVKFVDGSAEVRVTVTRGKVQVGDGEKIFDLLTPDEEIVVNTATSDFVKKGVKADAVIEWTEQFLVFDNITMGEAAVLLEKKFGVKLQFEREELTQCHISASFFYDEGLEHVLQVLGTVNNFTYHQLGDEKIRLEGSGNCQ